MKYILYGSLMLALAHFTQSQSIGTVNRNIQTNYRPSSTVTQNTYSLQRPGLNVKPTVSYSEDLLKNVVPTNQPSTVSSNAWQQQQVRPTNSKIIDSVEQVNQNNVIVHLNVYVPSRTGYSKFIDVNKPDPTVARLMTQQNLNYVNQVIGFAQSESKRLYNFQLGKLRYYSIKGLSQNSYPDAVRGIFDSQKGPILVELVNKNKLNPNYQISSIKFAKLSGI